MKKHISFSLLLSCFIAIAINSLAIAEPTLKMDWGLENTTYFQEVKVPADASSAIRAVAKPGDELYRFFQINDIYNNVIMGVFQRFDKSWVNFPQKDASSITELKYELNEYLKRNDPRLSAIIKQLAPTVYFDFLGESGVEYVLKEIEVNTIRFEEYSGGGFSDNEAWYDIELSHTEGIKKYTINDKKLRFSGSGRSILRFWSDNFYKYMGMAPMGCYDIDITFHFLANGKSISVSTGRFKIDV